jgi:hypothetical protein
MQKNVNLSECYVCVSILLTEWNIGTIQNMEFGVNTVIDLKNKTTTSDNTGTLVS